jgi:hypothetical protein
VMSGAQDHGRLPGVGETGLFRSDLEGIDLAGFMPSVALVERDVRRGKKRPLGRWRGWRAARRVWVDWL